MLMGASTRTDPLSRRAVSSASCGPYDVGEPVGHAVGLLARSAPRPSPAPAARCRRAAAAPGRCPASSASASATAAASDGVVVGARLVDVGDVDQHLRQPGHHARPAPAGDWPVVAIRSSDVERGQDAVAGGGVVAHDHVAGLLAAEGVAGELHRLEDVAVADLGLPDADARRSRIAWTKPRLLITVATTVSLASGRASRIARARIARIWSPSTTLPSWSTARQRSASPSRAKPTSAPCSRTASCSDSEVGRAAAVVDVQPVGRSRGWRTTSAPALAQRARAGSDAAPSAQSSTTLSPTSGWSMVADRWAT